MFLHLPLFVLSYLEQFDILNLEIISSISFFTSTNAEVFLIFTFLIILLMFFNYTKNMSWIPVGTQRLSYVLEITYQELMIIVFRNVGYNTGQIYFPWLIFIFLVISTLNLMGMLPFAFTITSHIIVTFLISFILFVGLNIRAMLDKHVTFTELFLPSGALIVIVPFLILIELISYIARVFSLAIRLFANMMAGHTLIKILIGFSFAIGVQNVNSNWPLVIVAIIPFILVFIITFLEVAIAILQAYVFTVIICLYIKDLHTAH